MSAIWGVIDLSGNKINKTVIDILKKPYDSCEFDRVEEIYLENAYMACGLQYFSESSVYE